MDEEQAAIAAKKKKRVNTKLAHLTEAQKKEHKNRQKRQSRRRKEGKDPATAPRLYSSPHNLSGVTDQERQQRLRSQKAASKQRLKQEAMVSKEEEDVLSTPPALSEEALLDEYDASIRKVHQERKAVEDAEEERELQEFQAEMEKEAQRVNQSSDNRLAMLQKKQEELATRRAARYEKRDEQLIRAAKYRLHTLSAKKMVQANTEAKRRRSELKAARHAPLEYLVGASVESPPALVSNETEHTETECLETERPEVSENGEHLESNGKDALNKLEGEESCKGENTNTDDGQVRAVDLVGEIPPPLKSVCTMKDVLFLSYFILCQVSHWIACCIFEQDFKTPSPKPKKSLLSSLFGGGSGQKKARVSFGVNKRMTYTPPDSDATRRMHGINEIRKFDVVITDLPVYKEWRRFHDAEFVKKFNDYHMSLMENPKDAKQILHAARVIEVLKELDVNKLRDLMKKVFPRYKSSFPKLKDSRSVEEFLKRVDRRLEEDAQSAPVELVKQDWVDTDEKVHKTHEMDHISW
jgi:hypothetical protein